MKTTTTTSWQTATNEKGTSKALTQIPHPVAHTHMHAHICTYIHWFVPSQSQCVAYKSH